MGTETNSAWFRESAGTNSYVAVPMRGGTQRYHDFLREAGEVFAYATQHFEAHPAGAGAVNTEGLGLHLGGGWQGFAGRLVTAYRRTHFDLIQGDTAYRDRLGQLMDSYPRLEARAVRHRHGETARARAKRYRHDGHEMVNTAITEGGYTIMAAYAVAPQTVRQSYPGDASPELVAISQQVLPSVATMARQLARHSKQGNEAFIRKAATRSSFNNRKINYKQLRFDPVRFGIVLDEHAQPELVLTEDARHPGDTTTYFSGCPALAGGSITRLNTLIGNIIRAEDCYERTLMQPSPTQPAQVLQETTA